MTSELSSCYLPEASDASLDIPTSSSRGLLDTSLQLPTAEESMYDASFQIPVAANATNLLMYDDFLGRTDDTLGTPLPPPRRDPLTLAELTPNPRTAVLRPGPLFLSPMPPPRIDRASPTKFKPMASPIAKGSREPFQPSPQNSPARAPRTRSDTRKGKTKVIDMVESAPAIAEDGPDSLASLKAEMKALMEDVEMAPLSIGNNAVLEPFSSSPRPPTKPSSKVKKQTVKFSDTEKGDLKRPKALEPALAWIPAAEQAQQPATSSEQPPSGSNHDNGANQLPLIIEQPMISPIAISNIPLAAPSVPMVPADFSAEGIFALVHDRSEPVLANNDVPILVPDRRAQTPVAPPEPKGQSPLTLSQLSPRKPSPKARSPKLDSLPVSRSSSPQTSSHHPAPEPGSSSGPPDAPSVATSLSPMRTSVKRSRSPEAEALRESTAGDNHLQARVGKKARIDPQSDSSDLPRSTASRSVKAKATAPKPTGALSRTRAAGRRPTATVSTRTAAQADTSPNANATTSRAPPARTASGSAIRKGETRAGTAKAVPEPVPEHKGTAGRGGRRAREAPVGAEVKQGASASWPAEGESTTSTAHSVRMARVEEEGAQCAGPSGQDAAPSVPEANSSAPSAVGDLGAGESGSRAARRDLTDAVADAGIGGHAEAGAASRSVAGAGADDRCDLPTSRDCRGEREQVPQGALRHQAGAGAQGRPDSRPEREGDSGLQTRTQSMSAGGNAEQCGGQKKAVAVSGASGVKGPEAVAAAGELRKRGAKRRLPDGDAKSSGSATVQEGSAEGPRTRRRVDQDGASGRLAASHPVAHVARPTMPTSFNFSLDARLETRRIEEEKIRTASRSQMTASSSSSTSGRPIPDFKALHAAHEASVASRREHIRLVVPEPFVFGLETRAKERERFEDARREKELEVERQAEARRKEREAEEEREYREARKRAIPKAHEVPEWYKDAPRRKGRE